MEGIMNSNQGMTAIKDRALLVLTLIVAGEGDHPAVKNALKSILSKLDTPLSEPEELDAFDSQPAQIIPFKRFQKKNGNQKIKKESPKFRIFSPENEEMIKVRQFAAPGKSPRLKVYVDEAQAAQ